MALVLDVLATALVVAAFALLGLTVPTDSETTSARISKKKNCHSLANSAQLNFGATTLPVAGRP